MGAGESRATAWGHENAMHSRCRRLWSSAVRHFENDGPVGTASPVHCARAFCESGCTVSVRPCAFQGAVLFERKNVCFPRIARSLHYQAIDRMLVRLFKD
jgi:hypothetical protein